MGNDQTWSTRATFRDHLLETVTDRLTERSVPIEGGPLDGVNVVSAGTIEEVIAAIRAEPLPPTSERDAEVRTPAYIAVTAYCPRCGQPSLSSVTITPELRVDADGGEIHLKAKALAVTHVCGQLPLPVGDSGQLAMDLADIIGPVPTVQEIIDAIGVVAADDAPFIDMATIAAAVPDDIAIIEGWSDLAKREVLAWAQAAHGAVGDQDVPPLPPELGGAPRPEPVEEEVAVDEGEPDIPPVVLCTEVEGCRRPAGHRGKHQVGSPE